MTFVGLWPLLGAYDCYVGTSGLFCIHRISPTVDGTLAAAPDENNGNSEAVKLGTPKL